MVKDVKPIMDDEGLDQTLVEIMSLMHCEDGSVEEERLKSLAAAVEVYEDEHYGRLYPLDADLREYMAEKEGLCA